MKEKYQVALVGAAGYTGGELLRLLVHHPQVQVQQLLSRSQSGTQPGAYYTDLEGYDLPAFTAQYLPTADVVFLCLGHGESETWMAENKPSPSTLVIDLSQDYRLNKRDGFTYALPEMNGRELLGKKRLANPGCFATAITLSLLPLVSQGWLADTSVYITATTGSTGAGQAASPATHFSWRHDNLSVYKPYTHQHEGEILQSLNAAGGLGHLVFTPLRGPFTRGILANASIPLPKRSFGEICMVYKDYYADAPFTRLHCHRLPALKEVLNTNHCHLGMYYGKDHLMVVAVIDNLLKGASGQALENMNLALGLPQRAGLDLKASIF